MGEPHLLRELTDDGVLLLTLNRPETMNALSAEISQGIMAAARESKSNDAIRVIVITGKGRGFCAGADLSGGGPAQGATAAPPRGRSVIVNKLGPGDLVMALADADVPVIGAINGAAAGAGFGLALCCDVRIASDKARMGSIFIKRGLATDYGASYWLPRVVGVARAFEVLYSGEVMDAPALLSLGLVNRVVPDESLMEEALAYARTIAQGPPLAYAYTRRNIVRSLDNDIRTQQEMEWVHQSDLLKTEDGREGFAAFRERRQPAFVGR